MKKLLLLIPLILFFACNNQPEPTTVQSDSTTIETDAVESKGLKGMKMSAVLPSGQQYDILANGDSIFYKTKDTTVNVAYTYKIAYNEIHPKGSTPPVNRPPVANAGSDISLTLPANKATLDGSNSTDPDNNITSYGWRKVSGPSGSTIQDSNKAIATIGNLRKGTYVYELRVVDAVNAFTADRVTVTVNDEVTPPTNQPPIARIQASATTITLPTNTVNLSAAASTDPDGSIQSWLWEKRTGPPVGSIGSSTSQQTTVSGLTTAGTYTYQLTVTDNQGSKGTSSINITVNPESTTPGATYNFSFTKNTAFKKRAFAGTENWNGQYYTSFPGGFSDYYFRFTWTDIEKVSQGNWSWTRFDQEIRKAINAKAKFSFGFMIVCDSDDFLSQEIINGSSSRYPKYVHDKMQSESVKDFAKNGQWIPNWNSTFLLDRHDAMLKAVADHVNTTSYNGVAYKDVINYVDIRSYGQWGEWHGVGYGDPITSMPSGTRPTVSTYKRFIDGHIAAFPNYPLVMLLAAMDAEWLGHTMTPKEVTDYILKAKNNWGLIGLRRDQWGATDNYVRDYLENNNRNYNGGPAFKTIIMERWKYAPWVGEPMGPGSNLQDLPRQVTFYHAASVGNGNYTANSTSQNQFKEAENNAGYKLSLLSGSLKTGNGFDINLTVENWGNTPCYENFDLVYELKNASGQVTWTGTSTWKPLLKLPGTHNVNDHFTGVPFNPNYQSTLTLTIKNNYRSMSLFNNGQASDGSINLKTFPLQ